MSKNHIKEKEEKILFKIITLGDSSVGKTSIIIRYLNNKFNLSINTTVGFNIFLKK